jgi:lipoate-protein ligase B
MAGPGQLVRGIIVVGREDERLRCSLDVLENVTVRTFL